MDFTTALAPRNKTVPKSTVCLFILWILVTVHICWIDAIPDQLLEQLMSLLKKKIQQWHLKALPANLPCYDINMYLSIRELCWKEAVHLCMLGITQSWPYGRDNKSKYEEGQSTCEDQGVFPALCLSIFSNSSQVRWQFKAESDQSWKANQDQTWLVHGWETHQETPKWLVSMFD